MITVNAGGLALFMFSHWLRDVHGLPSIYDLVVLIVLAGSVLA